VAVSFDPGDDICPPWWPSKWPGPRPPWWNEKIVDPGREVFVGLSLVNEAGRVSQPDVAAAIAKAGADLILRSSQQLSQELNNIASNG
jgi:hypothetical protein